MNTIKFFILNVLAIFCCHFNRASADTVSLPAYTNPISETYLGYDKAFLGGAIELPNGYVFKIVDYALRDDNVLLSWNKGDRVEFVPVEKGNQLFLVVKNLEGNEKNTVEPYVIFEPIVSSGGLRIVEITNEGKFVKLSDNSVWDFSWFNQFSTQNWKVGDRVLVQGTGTKNSYTIINFDVAPSKDSYEATATFVVK